MRVARITYFGGLGDLLGEECSLVRKSFISLTKGLETGSSFSKVLQGHSQLKRGNDAKRIKYKQGHRMGALRRYMPRRWFHFQFLIHSLTLRITLHNWKKNIKFGSNNQGEFKSLFFSFKVLFGTKMLSPYKCLETRC